MLKMGSLSWIILGVFALTLAGGLVRKLRKDACLKLFHADHVTFVGPESRTLWGDLQITSQGIELYFDAPHADERGLVENAAIIFLPELSTMIGLCRTEHGMTAREKTRREKQIDAILRPSAWSRSRRQLANLGGMLRDAFVDTLGLLVGQLSTSRRKSVAALADRQKQVSDVGGAILDLGARAYEPLLERHIGKPVIAQIGIPGAKVREMRFPGYLAEYNEKYFVLVNPTHAPEESFVALPGASAPNACASVARDGQRVEISSACDDALVVKRLVGVDRAFDLGAILLAGSRLSMHLPSTFELVRVELDRTRRLDFVCPRTLALIRFGSTVPPIRRSDWNGVGPG
jgi:hypothetical protein